MQERNDPQIEERIGGYELAMLIDQVPELSDESLQWVQKEFRFSDDPYTVNNLKIGDAWATVAGKLTGIWPPKTYGRSGFRAFLEKDIYDPEPRYVYLALLAAMGRAGEKGVSFSYTEDSSDLLPIEIYEMNRVKHVNPPPVWKTVSPILATRKPNLYSFISRITDNSYNETKNQTLNNIAQLLVMVGLNRDRIARRG